MARHGVTATPADKLVVDKVVVRGDPAILARQVESPAGVWLSNYVAKTITIRDADVQGMRIGISSPFYQEFRTAEPGRGDGSVARGAGCVGLRTGVSISFEVLVSAVVAGGRSLASTIGTISGISSMRSSG